MIWKIFLLSCCLTISATLITAADDADTVKTPAKATETSVQHSVSFETSHKRPENELESRNLEDNNSFQTAHKISPAELARTLTLNADMDEFVDVNSMNLLPTKERPELNPVLSALINEDVMKSIEAKRAIEEAELELIKAETDAAVQFEKAKEKEKDKEYEVAKELREKEVAAAELHQTATESATNVLTTAATPLKRNVLDDDDLNVGFVDQTINLDVAGSENNKKSRIEIKKGPNGQEYEYEYVYYYEDEDAEADSAKESSVKEPVKEKPKDNRSKPTAASVHEDEQQVRGKSRYTNIERNGANENSLTSGKTKGRSSGSKAAAIASDEVEVERLPTNTRFPSRGKNIEVSPTPALDSVENAAEKKRISVKRPSLELVDSETFNTDEKQVKGTRNGDTEAKPQKQSTAAPNKSEASNAVEPTDEDLSEENATMKSAEDADETNQTTPSMQKAALDLYAIIANANSDFNMEEMSTDSDVDVTTILPGITNAEDDALTTLIDEAPSSTTTTSTTSSTTTTTTTTPVPTTTTTTAAPSLFGRRGAGLAGAGRNRFKLNKGASTTTTVTPSTEASQPVEQPKSGKNRFSRPLPGTRNRGFSPKTTAAPAAPAAPAAEEEVAAKEVKPVSSGLGRGRPRNRFNLRGSTTTTEKPAESENNAQEEAVSSTTARTLRGGRPALSLRGRGSRVTTKAPVTDDETAANDKNEVSPATEDKPTPAAHSPVRPSRFNLNRAGGAGGNRLLPRGKFARTTEAPTTDDSSADSSHHNDIKGEVAETTEGEKAEKSDEQPTVGVGQRLKVRPRLNNLHKTENPKPHSAAAAASNSPVAPRKVNPLLAKRRLHLPNAAADVTSSTEKSSSPASEEAESTSNDDKEENSEVAEISNKDDTTEGSAETTTKQQARGLGLLGQRRRLPLRKPGTIN